MKNKPDGLFFNQQFCAEAQNCCDRRGEITCVISPRGLSVSLRHGGKHEKTDRDSGSPGPVCRGSRDSSRTVWKEPGRKCRADTRGWDGEDMIFAVQNPDNEELWSCCRVEGFGSWLEGEIVLEYQMSPYEGFF